MSTVEGQGGNVTNDEGNTDSTNNVDVNALMQRMEKLEATNNRLLHESKKYKTKAQSVNAEKESLEEKTLIESKNWEEILARRERKIQELTSDLEAKDKRVAKKEFEFSVSRYAGDAKDSRDVINNIDRGLIAFNDSTQEFEGIEDAINDVRSRKPWLFKERPSEKTVNHRPPSNGPKEKSLADRIAENPNDVLTDVLAEYFKK
jgi:molecular chaperone GrpE (heat shock protein)